MARPLALLLPLAVGAAVVPAQADAAAKRADLRAAGLSEPPATGVAAGTPFTLTAQVRNAGRAKAGPTALGVFLSRDARRSKGDLALPRLATKTIKKGRTLKVSGPVVVPATAKPGAYRLLVCADVAAKLKESAERNNCRVAKRKLSVLPAPPAPALPGAPVLVPLAEATQGVRVPLTVTYAPTAAPTDKLTTTLSTAKGYLSFEGSFCTETSEGNPHRDLNRKLTYTGFTAQQLTRCMERLRYRPAGDDASLDTITVETTLADGTKRSAKTDVAVIEANDPPELEADASAYALEEGSYDPSPSFFEGSQVQHDLGLRDLDGPGTVEIVRVTATNGTLTLKTPPPGLQLIEGDGFEDAAITMRADVATLDAALKALAFTGAKDVDTKATMTLHADDLAGRVDDRSIDITLGAANDPVKLTTPGAGALTLAEDEVLSFSGARKITVEDIDAPLVKATFTTTSGRLTLAKKDGLAFGAGDGDGTDDTTMTFRGSPAAVTAALDGATLTPPKDATTFASVQLTVSDEGRTGQGGTSSPSATYSVSYTAVNDAPVVQAPASFAQAQMTSSILDGPRAFTISDVDAGSAPVKVTVAVAQNKGGVDLQDTTGLTSIAGDGTATLSFRGSVAAVGAALSKAQFNRGNLAGPASMTVTVDDQGSTGSGGAQVGAGSVSVPTS